MFGVSACETPPPERVGSLVCPEILIPNYTENLVKIADGRSGLDITDIVYQAGVGYLSGTCTVSDHFIVMNFPVLVEFRKGPANRDNQAAASLFAAVMNQKKQRLTQNVLSYRVNFDNNSPHASINDPITIEIPKRPDQTGRDFIIYLGFELNREELNYNINAR